MLGYLSVALLVLSGLVLLWCILLLVRLRRLSNRVGSFECALRQGSKLIPGVAHYAVGRIEWYRAWSVAPRPTFTWYRDSLTLSGRQPMAGNESQYVVSCFHAGSPVELIMSHSAYSGFASWLEAAPPGHIALVL